MSLELRIGSSIFQMKQPTSWQRLSNQMTSWRHITTWHYDAVHWSLFHREDHLISKFFNSRDKQVLCSWMNIATVAIDNWMKRRNCTGDFGLPASADLILLRDPRTRSWRLVVNFSQPYNYRPHAEYDGKVMFFTLCVCAQGAPQVKVQGSPQVKVQEDPRSRFGGPPGQGPGRPPSPGQGPKR